MTQMKKITITLNIPDDEGPSPSDFTTEEIIDLIPLLNSGMPDFLVSMYEKYGIPCIEKILVKCARILANP